MVCRPGGHKVSEHREHFCFLCDFCLFSWNQSPAEKQKQKKNRNKDPSTTLVTNLTFTHAVNITFEHNYNILHVSASRTVRSPGSTPWCLTIRTSWRPGSSSCPLGRLYLVLSALPLHQDIAVFHFHCCQYVCCTLTSGPVAAVVVPQSRK